VGITMVVQATAVGDHQHGGLSTVDQTIDTAEGGRHDDGTVINAW
jgi:hypothetical protein